ncbi:ABC transporter substrate-binding protein [uncultured Friedmanniella sp.]|uniref:peptide ABC transporter substrate-binding protein n=1 Tax=uncultured Friedmanniella sp. TaxID=335381 RepID=UPI0035CC2331
MRGRTRAMAAAGLTTIALVASACGGGGGNTPEASTSAGGGAGGGEITINGCTPEAPLIAGNTSETCGGNIIDAFTAKLVHYNSDTAAAEMDLAQSIESKDNQNFTVKLKPGLTFTDGSPVDAKSFVDAWNYTAYGPNGQAGSYFFSAFAGIGDVSCPDADCKQKPKAKTLSGLKVVDDTTFTIKTTDKVSNLTTRLGYSAFSPQPPSFFADPDAFAKKPIGAGPFKVDSISSTETVLSKNADYKGVAPAKVDKVTFRVYQDPSAAYNDVVANNLDVVDAIPPDQLIGDQYKTDLDGRNGQREIGGNDWVTFSPNDPQLKDNPALRKAISMAIDRAGITQTVFNGTRTPATGWVPPAVDGYKAGACGDACTFDAAKAKAAFDAAGGYKGTLTYTTNVDGAGNAQAGEAVCNSIKNALGVDCRLNSVNDFATFNKGLDSGDYKGIFRSAWQMDYPSIENFLAPIYGKGADSNYSEYASPDFNSLLQQAAAAGTPDEANALYQQAEAKLGEDFPTAPIDYKKATFGWSTKVDNVKITPFGTPDLSSITVK